MMSFVLQNSAARLSEWLRFHCKTQGANAALLINRLPDQNAALWQALKAALENTPVDGLEELVWLDVPVPVGHPDLGPETARINAPDAPGKALLKALPADPWRSQLYEVGLFESLRTRFLHNARAVLFMSPADILAPPARGEPSVFDAATTGTGFLRIAGRRAYPFALKRQKHPLFGEHNCRAFDSKGGDTIWCLAPSKLAPDAHWRQFRVNAPLDPQSAAFRFWRCMGLRHPGLKPSEIVPKTSLIEDNALTRVLKSHFDGAPKSPPKAEAMVTAPLKNERITIVTTMKNEGPFILDWLAYHRAIGVTDVLVYTNDCTDGTDDFLKLLAQKGLVTHRENPFDRAKERPQHAALFNAQSQPVVQTARWMRFSRRCPRQT